MYKLHTLAEARKRRGDKTVICDDASEPQELLQPAQAATVDACFGAGERRTLLPFYLDRQVLGNVVYGCLSITDHNDGFFRVSPYELAERDAEPAQVVQRLMDRLDRQLAHGALVISRAAIRRIGEPIPLDLRLLEHQYTAPLAPSLGKQVQLATIEGDRFTGTLADYRKGFLAITDVQGPRRERVNLFPIKSVAYLREL